MAAAVARHLALLDAAIQAHGGVLFKVGGDAVQSAFPPAPEAVATVRWKGDHGSWRRRLPRQWRSRRS